MPLRPWLDPPASAARSAGSSALTRLETIRRAPKVAAPRPPRRRAAARLRSSSWRSEYGYTALPTTDVDDLDGWFNRGGKRNDLVLYLETFAHTVGVMQHRDAIERVAAECAEDLAADGVVYAEVRFAPEQHIEAGPDHGRGRGRRPRRVPPSARPGTDRDDLRHPVGHAHRGPQPGDRRAGRALARCRRGRLRHRRTPRRATRPTRHLDAFQYVQRENFHTTIHAGEAFGLPSIWEAMQFCGAERLGHGVRIVDDIEVEPTARHHLGRLAAYIRDRRIPLELCPTSNVNTGVVDVHRRPPHRAARASCASGSRSTPTTG